MFILMLLWQAFNTIRLSSRQQNGLMQLQETGRMANLLLSEDIRKAGHIGCRSVAPDYPIQSNIASTEFYFLQGISLQIFHADRSNTRKSWTPTLPEKLKNSVLPSTDVIVIERTHDKPNYLKESLSSTGSPLAIQFNHSNQSYVINDYLIISDCIGADLIRIDTISGSDTAKILHYTTPLSHAYAKLSELARFKQIAYYIQKTGRKNAAGNLIYALYRKQLFPEEPSQEIVEGISNMLIMQYKDNIEIKLEIHSIDILSDKPEPYLFAGEIKTPTTQQGFREWKININLRN